MSEAAIVGMLVRYVAHVISAERLERDLPDGWDLDRQSDADVRSLVLRTMGYLAEYRNGERSENDLRQAIRSLALSRSPTEAVSAKTHGLAGGPSRYYAENV
jgi:hypothetical protein